MHLSPWQWLCLGLALLWAGTMFAWWRTRRRGSSENGNAPEARIEPGIDSIAETASSPPPAAGAAAKQLRGMRRAAKPLPALAQACRDNDAPGARRALLDWAAGVWPDAPPRGLNALAERLDDAGFQDLLRQLDRACYAGQAWQGELLAQAFKTPPKPEAAGGTDKAIPGLYADG